MTFQRTNRLYSMPLTPARIGVKVRTTGTKRASTIARGPYRSKNSWPLSTLACLKNRESGRLNRDGPTRAPNAYPTWSPTTAAIQMPSSRGTSGRWRLSGKSAGPEARNPAVNRSASPGRKNPIRRPDSANTIAKIPRSPKVSIRSSGLSTRRP